MANDTAMHNAIELGNADEFGELIIDGNRGESTQVGLFGGHQSAHAHFLQKKADRDMLIRNAAQFGTAPPEADMKAADAAVERADFERQAAYEAMHKHSKTESIPAKTLLREAEFYLATNAPYLRKLDPPKIKVAPRKALEDAAAVIDAKRREKRAWRDRPAPLSMALAAARANLDAMCIPIEPTVSDDGRLGWDSLARGIDIRGHDKIERVFDPLPYFLAVPGMKQTIADSIERTLRDRYAGIKDTATETEKRIALNRLDGEILELQRVQVAAVRALRAVGEWLPFPPKIDVRAVLNVAGPKPRPRD